MPTYNVTLPLAGTLHITVEADDEDAAKAAAFQVGWDCKITRSKDAPPECDVELGELDTYEQLTQGNVLYAPQNDVEIEEI